MSDTGSHTTTAAQSWREMRPEHITIAGEEFERNDVTARRYGTTERSVNRGDANGAPYLTLHGVKYRPTKRYDEFIRSKVQIRKAKPLAPPVRRRRARC